MIKMKALLFASAIIAGSVVVNAQQKKWEDIGTDGFFTKDSIKQGKYTLIFINKDSAFSLVTKQRMIDAFFKVYPEEVKRFNKKSLQKVVFVIDSAYKGVAATSNGIVKYSPEWFFKHPEDIDVVTHEVMHIVQDYKGQGPGWVTEGIADYVRYKYGVNNEKGNWSLPDVKPAHNYDNAYRVTARFFVWIEKNKNKSFVDEMNKHMREGTYKPELWKQLTGMPVDELWKAYIANPAI